MENKYENLFSEIEKKILLLIIQAKIMNDLTDIRNKYLSKKGEFSVLMNKIKEADDKKAFGEAYNFARRKIETALSEKIAEFQKMALEEKLKAESIDITLPGKNSRRPPRLPDSRRGGRRSPWQIFPANSPLTSPLPCSIVCISNICFILEAGTWMSWRS